MCIGAKLNRLYSKWVKKLAITKTKRTASTCNSGDRIEAKRSLSTKKNRRNRLSICSMARRLRSMLKILLWSRWWRVSYVRAISIRRIRRYRWIRLRRWGRSGRIWYLGWSETLISVQRRRRSSWGCRIREVVCSFRLMINTWLS